MIMFCNFWAYSDDYAGVFTCSQSPMEWRTNSAKRGFFELERPHIPRVANDFTSMRVQQWSWDMLWTARIALANVNTHANTQQIGTTSRWRVHRYMQPPNSPSLSSSMHSNVISNWKGFKNGDGLSKTTMLHTFTLAISTELGYNPLNFSSSKP